MRSQDTSASSKHFTERARSKTTPSSPGDASTQALPTHTERTRSRRPRGTPLSVGSANYELEAAAGVSRIKGRGWYGLRRILMDTAPKYTSNEMTLNTLAGTSTDMRNSVYQDQESLEAKVD